MIPRCFFALCAFVLFISVISFVAAEEPEVDVPESDMDEDVESRNPALALAVRILVPAFKWAAKNCIEQAAHSCKQHWKNAGQLIKCAGSFLQANKGRCVLG